MRVDGIKLMEWFCMKILRSREKEGGFERSVKNEVR
jgi:hypothetical protein